MIRLYADKNELAVQAKEPLTSASVNINTVHFDFSPHWHGLTKTAVFKTGGDSFSVLLTQPECPIPWEALTTPGRTLYAGVYGTKDGSLVLPTTWASLGEIQEGVKPGEDAQNPTPGVYEQITGELANKADSMAYDGLTLSLKAGEKVLSAVEIAGGGGIPGPKGDKGDPGPEGPRGKDGTDGASPHIGENGNWFVGSTDIGIPATGPQGPAGSETYSTEETRVGTWIDGKSLYRRVILAQSTPTIDKISTIFTGLKNMDTCVSLWAQAQRPQGVFSIPNSQNDLGISPDKTSILNVVRHSSYLNLPLTIRLEYTKTTD